MRFADDGWRWKGRSTIRLRLVENSAAEVGVEADNLGPHLGRSLDQGLQTQSQIGMSSDQVRFSGRGDVALPIRGGSPPALVFGGEQLPVGNDDDKNKERNWHIVRRCRG